MDFFQFFQKNITVILSEDNSNEFWAHSYGYQLPESPEYYDVNTIEYNWVELNPDKGGIGDQGSRGPPGPPGEKGAQGGMSEEGKRLIKELLELLASKNIISTEEQIKLTSYLY